MTRYYVRFDSAAGLVPVVDLSPHEREGRRVMLRGAVAGGALAFGVTILRLPATDVGTTLLIATAGVAALAGGGALAMKMAGDGALEWRRQSDAFDLIRHMTAHGTMPHAQIAEPDETDGAPALPEPDTRAERQARQDALSLLSDSATVIGWGAATIPRHDKIGWRGERRARVVGSLADHIEVAPGKVTTLRRGTLRELYDEIVARQVKPSLTPPAAVYA